MKKKGFLLATLLMLLLCGSASSYEISIIGEIPLGDRVNAVSFNPATGKGAAISSESKTLYIFEFPSFGIAHKVSLSLIPTGIAIDQKRNTAIVSLKGGTLHFIELDSGVLLTVIATGRDIDSIAVNKDEDSVYLGSGDSVLVMALETGNSIREVHLSSKPIGMDIEISVGYLVMISEGKDGLSLYGIGTLVPVAEIKTGTSPSGVAVNPSTSITVLANNMDNSLSIVSLENRAVLDTLPFERPGAVAIDLTRNMALIGHKKGITVVHLENPVPKIESLIPESTQAGSAGLTLSIKGSRFIKDSRARFDLRELETLFEDNYSLKAFVPSEELLSSRDVPVTVLNPRTGGGVSNSILFRIINPIPQIESLSPDTMALAMPPPEIKVKGRNFLPGSVVNLNGRDLQTKFISSILLGAQLDFKEIKIPARYPVTVINPLPVSLASNVVFLDVVEDETGLSLMGEKDKRKEESVKTIGTLKGRILNTQKRPIEGVKVRIKNLKTETDSDGYFTLNDVPSGKRHLMIHGETAKKKDKHHPTIPLTVDIEPDKINEMPFQIYLHEQKNRNFKEITSSEDTVLTDPEVPGFEMRIPKGVKITGWDGKPNQRVSVRTVPTDRLPVKPIPDNSYIRSVYMFYFDKVGGGVPEQPIPIKAPNDLGLLPGEKAVLWYYDESPNEGEAPNDWAIAGTGTVTPDGMRIVTDPGVGVPKFCCGAIAWGGDDSSPPPNNDCDNPCGCGSGGSGGSGGGGGGFGGGPGGPQVSGTAGDPVDLATGYFIHAKTDLYVPGVIPVSITRYFRSGNANIGAFGRGTYFEYDWWMGAYGADGQINNSNPTMYLLVKPGNHKFRFSKQPDGTFINTVDPAMRGAVVTKNADNTRTLRMRDGWTYKFDLSGDMTEIADRNGNKLTLTRRTDFEGGYLREIVMPDGKKITFNQTFLGLVAPRGFFRTNEIIDHTGRSIKYTYETDTVPINGVYYPRLKKVEYPDSSSFEYRYDSSGRMSGFINERGVLEVLNEYDTNNRVIRQTHADGGVYTFSYTTAGGYITETRMTAPNGGTTTWRFNNWAYITDVTTPDGTTTYEREPGTNQILSVTDPMGRRMVYAYDPKGRVTAITDNAGNITRYEYENVNSRVTKSTDAIGNITNMTYDAKGNMLTLTTPDNKTTTFTYNSIGKPLTVTDALGNVSTMQYDTSGNLIRVTDPLGNASQMAYDNLGRMTTMTDAKGKSTLYNYDVIGRITNVTDPIGNITRYGYSLDGKLSVVQDAKNQIIRYDYDSRGRLMKMTDQLGKIETYTYDTSDNLTSMTDRKGQITTYTYDLMNRLTRATYADGSYTNYTYDAAGRLISVSDSVSGSISYTYSGTGCGTGCSAVPDKVIQEVTPLGTISYTYDVIGRRTSMTVLGQPAVNYGYDSGSRLASVGATLSGSPVSFGIGYDGLGRRSSLTLPNGVTTNYSYDNGSRLLNLEHKNPVNQILESLTYTYDANGNRISMNRPSVSLPLPNAVTSTSYNEANQMLTFNASTSSARAMTYDNNGNMTSVINSCGTTTYSWDVRNRLIGIIGFKPDCSALTASFGYDALGRRIEKTINGVTTQYVYDGLDIIQEKQSGAVTANYIRTMNIDEPMARIKADGTVRYYQTDALGSVIALTDGTGAVKTTYAYDPFGNTTVSGEVSDNPFQYTGRENDGTGLYYYRARYYSPELQRFISEDPIRLEGGDINYLYYGGVNFYAYVLNNPTGYIDPTGEIPQLVAGIVCAVPVALGLIGSFLTSLKPNTGPPNPYPDPYNVPDLPVDPIRTGPPPKPPRPPIIGR